MSQEDPEVDAVYEKIFTKEERDLIWRAEHEPDNETTYDKLAKEIEDANKSIKKEPEEEYVMSEAEK